MASQRATTRGSEFVLVSVLPLLTAANDLKSFTTAARTVETKPGSIVVDCTALSIAASLTRAWANGLKLLLRDVRGSVLDAPAAALRALSNLTIWMADWSQSLGDRPAHGSLSVSENIRSAATEPELVCRMNLAQQMAKSGALQMLANFCSAAAADLHRRNKHQQQQQLALQRPEAACLMGNILDLWRSLLVWWPGKVLEGNHGLAVTVKPLITLAAAIITTDATAQAADAGEDDANTLAASSAGANSRQIDYLLAHDAIGLGTALLEVIHTEGFTGPKPSSAVPLVLEIAAAGDMLLLAAAILSSYTRWLWHKQRQQQQGSEHLPEAYHVQLMQKLGCPGLETDMQVYQIFTAPESTRALLTDIINTIALMLRAGVQAQQQDQQQLQTLCANDSVLTDETAANAATNKGSSHVDTAGATPSKEHEDNSSSSSNSSSSVRTGLPTSELASVLLELLVLLPIDIGLLWAVHGAVNTLILYELTVPSPSSISNPRISSGGLLEPLLFCMGPAVAKMLQTSKQQDQHQSSSTPSSGSSAAAAAADAVPEMPPEQQMKEDFAGLLLMAITSGEADPQRLAAAILKQPQTSISSLCLGMQTATAVIIAGRQLAACPLDFEPHSCAHIVAAAVKAVLDFKRACGGDVVEEFILSVNHAAKWIAAMPELQQQMFSLLLCCNKVAAQYKPDDVHDKMYGILSTSIIASVAARMGCILIRLPYTELPAQPASRSSNSSDKADRVAGVQPWLVLVARSLNIMGASTSSLLTMQGPDQANAPGAEQGSKRNVGRVLAAGPVWQYMQQSSCEAIAMLQYQQQLLEGEASAASGMPSLAATAEKQVLLQQQDVLQNALVNALERVEGLCRIATSNNTPTTSNAEVLAEGELLLSQLGQQLQQAGVAVCAALPVPYCCNNPGCCSFRGESEQQLVSGKGCVCGGCQVARYCGTECQTAHWQQHKAVCKRIKKERLAGSSTSTCTAELSSVSS